MTTETLPTTTQGTDEKRSVALLKAVGLDKVSPEQRELALNIAARYELDLLLKHLVLIDGRAYITRDGLIHVAHRSGVFDGIEVTPAEKVEGYWRSTCSVYRKDMTRPFTYPGRYPTTGGNQKYAEEMAVKVAEVAALRRAFDVSAPTVEERWDGEEEVPEQPKARSLAELARARREAVVTVRDGRLDVMPPIQDAPQAVEETVVVSEATVQPEVRPCGHSSPYGADSLACTQLAGHQGVHRNGDKESWAEA